MRRKPKKIIIEADEYIVINAQTYSGEVIDWNRENVIRDRILDEHPGLREDSAEFESILWLECPDCKLKIDPLTERLHIYRDDCWIEYKLVIRYYFEGKHFEKIIECQWNQRGIPKGCKLDVCFYDNNPEELIWLREHQDPFIRSIIEILQQRLFAEEHGVCIFDNNANQGF